MNPTELCVHRWTYLDAAVGNTDAVPSCPELCVFASVGESYVSHSWSIVLENVGHLQNGYQWVPIRPRVPKPRTSLWDLVLCTYLVPFLIAPLLEEHSLGVKRLDRPLSVIQQLYTDVVLAATIPSRRIPNVNTDARRSGPFFFFSPQRCSSGHVFLYDLMMFCLFINLSVTVTAVLR